MLERICWAARTALFGTLIDCYNAIRDGIDDLAYLHPLAGTDPETPGVEQCEEQVRRILRSATFRNASTLQQLLTFLAAKSIAGAGETLKEYTIGVDALGRKGDFDPKIDPIVRVQSHRLRTKLKEYYSHEGSHDPILILIPKGHYLPTFEPLIAGSILEAAVADVSEIASPDLVPAGEQSTRRVMDEVQTPVSPRHRSGWLTSAITLALMIGIGFGGFWVGHLNPKIQSGNGETSPLRNAAKS
jgi:hypothetical protein